MNYNKKEKEKENKFTLLNTIESLEKNEKEREREKDADEVEENIPYNPNPSKFCIGNDESFENIEKVFSSKKQQKKKSVQIVRSIPSKLITKDSKSKSKRNTILSIPSLSGNRLNQVDSLKMTGVIKNQATFTTMKSEMSNELLNKIKNKKISSSKDLFKSKNTHKFSLNLKTIKSKATFLSENPSLMSKEKKNPTSRIKSKNYTPSNHSSQSENEMSQANFQLKIKNESSNSPTISEKNRKKQSKNSKNEISINKNTLSSFSPLKKNRGNTSKMSLNIFNLKTNRSNLSSTIDDKEIFKRKIEYDREEEKEKAKFTNSPAGTLSSRFRSIGKENKDTQKNYMLSGKSMKSIHSIQTENESKEEDKDKVNNDYYQTNILFNSCSSKIPDYNKKNSNKSIFNIKSSIIEKNRILGVGGDTLFHQRINCLIVILFTIILIIILIQS